MGNNVTNIREKVKELYKDMLEKNAALICSATQFIMRSHCDKIVRDTDDGSIDLVIIDPSEEEMKTADIVYQLSNPTTFDHLSVSDDTKSYVKECFADDLQELLRTKYGMALYQLDTIYEGIHTREEHNDPKNYDKDGNYCGPNHNGIELSFIEWN